MINGLKKTLRLSLFVFLFGLADANAYDWQVGESIPEEGLSNPYQWSQSDLPKIRRQGLVHALNWPVDVTGALIPYEATKLFSDFGAQYLGLHRYPSQEGAVGPYWVPYANGRPPHHRMGFSLIEAGGTVGYTFSCAACHSSNMFGRKIMGLTNRFPRSNETFVRGQRWANKMTPDAFQLLLGASTRDTLMYQRTRNNLQFVEAKKPSALGLDTSLAHVALSLSHRKLDDWASKDPRIAKNPREEILRHQVADSKPAVWWNVKYKNKWLLDGSVVSGNPILTNLIWNELGRGTDLRELQIWFEDNPTVVAELTTAVYASEPPRYTDFFKFTNDDLRLAKEGEVIFENRCAKCHGHYEKSWHQDDSMWRQMKNRVATVRVRYFEDTPVKDVGTDPARRLGMESLLQLNDLAISKRYGIRIEMQEGYVPPPLEGIWARFPYFHNNSIPNLCELLKPAADRVSEYWSGDMVDPKRDFDKDCNGYPVGRKTPVAWKMKPEHYFDTLRPGLGREGHDKGFAEFTDQDRRALIRFLQTL